MDDLNQLQQIKIQKQLDLKLSSNGQVQVKGEVTNEQLQAILDSSLLRSRIYQESQLKIEKEVKESSILIGCYFSLIVGLIVFLGTAEIKNQLTPKHSQITTGVNYNA